MNPRPTTKGVRTNCSYAFHTPCLARYRVLYLISVMLGGKDFLVICLARLGVIFLLRKSDIAPVGRSDIIFAPKLA